MQLGSPLYPQEQSGLSGPKSAQKQTLAE